MFVDHQIEVYKAGGATEQLPQTHGEMNLETLMRRKKCARKRKIGEDREKEVLKSALTAAEYISKNISGNMTDETIFSFIIKS